MGHCGKRIYPQHQEDMYPLKNWYYTLKTNCLTCMLKEETKPQPIELHHLKRATKYDEVSNLFHRKAPLAYLMVEMLKCIPLCSEHHADYHRCERSTKPYDISRIKRLYDFESKDYQEAIERFQQDTFYFAPPVLIDCYDQFMRNRDDMFYRATLGRSYSPNWQS